VETFDGVTHPGGGDDAHQAIGILWGGGKIYPKNGQSSGIGLDTNTQVLVHKLVFKIQ